MGALAGALYPDPFQVRQLSGRMLTTMRHRLSNETISTHTYRNAQIAGTALNLHSNEKGTRWVAYDAQIANQKELSDELSAAGYPVTSDNLGALLLYAYVHWGTEFVLQLDGDFAIAILDQEKEEVLLYRDRVGKKPLYWSECSGHLLFASELKALLGTGVIPATPAVDAMANYLFMGYFPQDMSPVENVNKLLPGYFLRCKLSGEKRIAAYWSCSAFFHGKNSDSPEEVREQLNELLIEAVNKRVGEKEKIGTFLSGGLGSAAITHYLKERNPTAFTAVFQKADYDDLAHTETVARSLRVPHEYRSLSLEQLLKQLVPTIWLLDEPLADPNIVLSSNLADLAQSRDRSVVFSGMGMDELLGAHLRYHSEAKHGSLTRTLASLPRPLVRRLAIPLLRLLSPRLANKILRHTLTAPNLIGFLRQQALFSERRIRKVSPQLAPFFDADVFLQKFYQMVTIKEAMSSTQYIDIKTRLPDLYIHQIGRFTAAKGLRWETPFLSHPVFEFLAGLPAQEIKGDEELALPLQQILKESLEEPFIKRKKKTRHHYLSSWSKEAPMQEALRLLQSGTLVESGFLVPSAISALAERPGNFRKLFGLLALEIWLRLFIDSPIGDHPPKVWVSELLRSRI